MGKFANFNKSAGYKFAVNSEGFDFRSLKELEDGETYPVKGVFVNTKSKFGDKPVIISDGFFVDLPAHQMDAVKQILGDVEMCKDIDAGKAAFTVRSYASKQYGKCYSIDWVDVE